MPDNEKEFKQIYSMVPAPKKSKWSKFKSFMSYDVTFSAEKNSIFKEIKDFWNQDIRFRRAKKRGLWLPAPMPEPVLIPIPIDEQRYDNKKDLKNDKIKVEAEGTKEPDAEVKDDNLFKISGANDAIQKEIDDIFGDLSNKRDKDDERSLSNKTSKSPYFKIDL